MLYSKALLGISIGILLSSPSLAGIYQWTDKNGKIHFSDQKPEAQDASKETVKKLKIRDNGGYGLPVVEQLTVIPYTGYDSPVAFSLAKIKLNIENADYQRVKMGQLLSGPNCTKKVKEIYWSDGNGYIDDYKITYAIFQEINKAGYKLSPPQSEFAKQDQRLTLKAELITVKLNSCTKPKERKSLNEAYIKVKWELYDKLQRKNIYSGTSTGSSNNTTHSKKFKSANQAISSSFVIATNNLLADPQFIKFINAKKEPEPLFKSYDPLAVNLIYAKGDSSFKQRLKNLQ